MKKLISSCLLIITFLFYSASSLANNGIITEVKVSTSELISVIKSKLHGSKIRLNSYGKRRGYSWHKKNDSYVKVGNFYNKKFNIPELKKGPYKYNVNDINLKSYNITAENGRFRLNFYFENHGNEIKGRCKGKWYKTGALCINGSDGSAPDVHINNAIATAYLTPSVRNHSISFSNVTVDFNANVRVGKTCRKISYCRILVGRVKNILRNVIRNQIRAALNKNSLKNLIANKTKTVLNKKGIKRIISLKLGKHHTTVKVKINI